MEKLFLNLLNQTWLLIIIARGQLVTMSTVLLLIVQVLAKWLDIETEVQHITVFYQIISPFYS